MNEQWKHQVRLHVDDVGRALLDEEANKVVEALKPHDGVLVSQLDAFEAYLADPGQAATPLGRWTAMTLADPDKRAKHGMVVSVRVGGAEVYDVTVADALELVLKPFVDDGTLLRVSRHDTNPSTNLPIPPEYTR